MNFRVSLHVPIRLSVLARSKTPFGNALSCKASALQESAGKSLCRKLNFFSIKLKNIIDNINYVCYYDFRCFQNYFEYICVFCLGS